MSFKLAIQFPPTPNGLYVAEQEHDTLLESQAEAALWLSGDGIQAERCFINGEVYAPQLVIDWEVEK